LESKILDRKPEYINRIAIFVFSAALHVAGLYVILHTKYNYKVFNDREKATAVVLLPEDAIRLPKVPIRIMPSSGPPEPVIIKPGRNSEPSAQGQAEQREAQKPAPPAGGGGAENSQDVGVAAQSRSAGRGGAQPAEGPFPGFHLTYPKNAPLNLAKPSENPLDALLRPNRYRDLREINFSKYAGSGASRTGSSGGGGPSGPGGKGSGGQSRGAGVSVNIRRYDLAPWANQVLTKIQKNWSLGRAGNVGWKGEVGISVMIAKSGELLSAEIATPSKVEVLDQAALKALQACAPFPPLPADFPNSSLELYFVFEYGH
jgi:TonB family protein